jgi:hypothetical protein
LFNSTPKHGKFSKYFPNANTALDLKEAQKSGCAGNSREFRASRLCALLSYRMPGLVEPTGDVVFRNRIPAKPLGRARIDCVVVSVSRLPGDRAQRHIVQPASRRLNTSQNAKKEVPERLQRRPTKEIRREARQAGL